MARAGGRRQAGERWRGAAAPSREPQLDSRALALRAALVARRGEIESRLRDRLAGVRGDARLRPAAGALDDLDASADDLQREISFAAMQAQSDLLQRIDEALDRLARGEYGRCRECGDDIADVRLQAMPFAVRCVECERRRERAHAASRGLRTSRLAVVAAGGAVDLA